MLPNWNVTPEERPIIDKIVKRAGAMFPEWDKICITMDVVATHNHVCRLRLADLLAADNFNFAHDIAGITNNLDRENLVLMNCFLPRFTESDRELNNLK